MATKSAAFIVSMLLLSGCAATYAPPQSSDLTASATIPKSKSEILTAARQVIVSQGYQITAFDDRAGIISTAPRNVKIGVDEADCGSTMGINYLWDNRTTTRVGFGVIGSDGKLEVRANIEGEYRPGSAVQDLTLSCRSKGVLDRDMLQRIQTALASQGSVTLSERASSPPPPNAAPAATSAAEPPTAPIYSAERIDQLVAPIALYPDDLIALILTASTYPEELAEAARWIETRTYTSVSGDRESLRERIWEQDWDPSVSSLVYFPKLLTMMSADPQWIDALGDAVLSQLPEVMNAVQRLRTLAWNAGWMQLTPFQQFEKQGTRIVILPPTTGVLYIPYYDPRTSFGPRPHPGWSPVVLTIRGRPLQRERSYVELDMISATVIQNPAELDWSSQAIAVDTHWYEDIEDYTPIRAQRSGYVWFHDPIHRRNVSYRFTPARERVLPVPARSAPVAANVRAPQAVATPPSPTRTESPSAPQGNRFGGERERNGDRERARERERTQTALPPTAPSSEPVRARPSQANEPLRGQGTGPAQAQTQGAGQIQGQRAISGQNQEENSAFRRRERPSRETAAVPSTAGSATADTSREERRRRPDREEERSPTMRPSAPIAPTPSSAPSAQPASASSGRNEATRSERARPQETSPSPAAASRPEPAKATAPHPPQPAPAPAAAKTPPEKDKKKDPNDKSN